MKKKWDGQRAWKFLSAINTNAMQYCELNGRLLVTKCYTVSRRHLISILANLLKNSTPKMEIVNSSTRFYRNLWSSVNFEMNKSNGLEIWMDGNQMSHFWAVDKALSSNLGVLIQANYPKLNLNVLMIFECITFCGEMFVNSTKPNQTKPNKKRQNAKKQPIANRFQTNWKNRRKHKTIIEKLLRFVERKKTKEREN